MDENQNPTIKYWGMSESAYTILMHVSQFAGILIPYAGFILPIIIWISNKEKNENINEQGKYITNWLLSSTIYLIIFGTCEA